MNNKYIVAGTRKNTNDNSVYNLNVYVYSSNSLKNWIDDMYDSEDGDGFPPSDVLFDELNRKGQYRFSTKVFMFLIKSENSALT